MKLFSTLFVLLLALGMSACGGGSDAPEDSPSAAAPAVELPVESITLGEIDAALASEGEGIYKTRCATCHKMDTRYVGPALRNVTAERTPEYVMNMILAPEKMLQADSTAQALLADYGVPMTNQNLTQEQARAILEYLRQVHAGS